MYYLQSRYYDPEIGRFINADGLVSTGQGILGNNMYAYCLNNPVNYSDETGTFPWLVVGIIVACVAVIGADHYLAANQPKGGYAAVNETNEKGATKKGLYAEGNGFNVDVNGVTVCDMEAGVASFSYDSDYIHLDVMNVLSTSATAALDWSGVPSLDVSAVASIYTGGADVTVPIGPINVTVSAVGHLGSIGAGIELDAEEGKFKITPPSVGVSGSIGVDFDIRWD